VVVAGGKGTRFGRPKQFVPVLGHALLWWALKAPLETCDGVVVVLPAGEVEARTSLSRSVPLVLGADTVMVNALVPGGDTRSESVRNGLAALPPEAKIVVVHDAARPLATAGLFAKVIQQVRAGAQGVVPALGVTDTVKEVEAGKVVRTLDRSRLVAVQTPQAFLASALAEAHSAASEATDDAALLESLSLEVQVVPGEHGNIKVTTEEDLRVVERRLSDGASPESSGQPGIRVGFGVDLHAFQQERNGVLRLGGVDVPGAPSLSGHSDGDALIHALCDALLGSCGRGDIGVHFPPGDESLRGIDSTKILLEVLSLVRESGNEPLFADCTVVTQRPRLQAHLPKMASVLSSICGFPVSVKATSPEGMGALGRGEGVQAFALVLTRSG
jgi:2-C-methyl-D-erythritol 4-phosphate cytidylyltransferase/2-C-methyl-D-erythritol 2,4-cyclodiphosphate synthase